MTACDVGVIPLLDEEIRSAYGQMKSNSRLIAMWSVGLATVVSPLKSYVETIREGEDGFIAESQRDWIRLVELLRDDAALRLKLGRNARERAYTEFGFRRQLDDYFAVFNRAREKQGVLV
jgi:glycosyltransferase involved in cell wall biosynthesis